MTIPASVLNFLESHRVCSLAVTLKDGTPHGAAMHYSHNSKEFEIYIQTEKDSKKCEAISDGQPTKATVVIGFSEDEWKTFQADGDIILVSDARELKNIHKIHYQKHPEAEKYKDLPETVFVKFIPRWWRYTEFKPQMKVFTSES